MKNLLAWIDNELVQILDSLEKKRELARAEKALQKALKLEVYEHGFAAGSFYHKQAMRDVAQCRLHIEKLTGADPQGFISN